MLNTNERLVEYVKKLEKDVLHYKLLAKMSESVVEALDAFLPNAVKNYKREVRKLNEQHKESNQDPRVRDSNSGDRGKDIGSIGDGVQQARNNEHNK